jgi:hypothetical protein
MAELNSETLPDEVIPWITEFQLPTGVALVRRISSSYNLSGWAISVHMGLYVYADGTVGSGPRHQAYEELGFEGGDDDLKNDDDWKAVAELEERNTRLLIMDFPTALKVAKDNGYCNRAAKIGEEAVLRRSGEKVTVTHASPAKDPPFQAADGHQFIKVRMPDGEEKTEYLWSLILDD